MPTTVTNIRYQDYDVYIGRAGHDQDGYFGNPVIRDEKCFVCSETHTKPGETIECYRAYFQYRISIDDEFLQKIQSLKDKKLGCFCKPHACHGDIISEYLNA